MDFKSFSETRTGKEPDKQPEENQPAGAMSENDVRRAINHFGKMSNDQLMRELSRHLAAKKAQGREHEISGVIERIKPLLNDQQRLRLNEIMRDF